jgi:hypothetical protein
METECKTESEYKWQTESESEWRLKIEYESIVAATNVPLGRSLVDGEFESLKFHHAS